MTGVYLWLFWRYLNGEGPPPSTAVERRASLRANRLSACVWVWALLAGGLGIVTLVLALRVANRLVVLPHQSLQDLSQVPTITAVSLLFMAAPVAGVVEEAASPQGPWPVSALRLRRAAYTGVHPSRSAHASRVLFAVDGWASTGWHGLARL